MNRISVELYQEIVVDVVVVGGGGGGGVIGVYAISDAMLKEHLRNNNNKKTNGC